MRKKKQKNLLTDENCVRVIKISEDAFFELYMRTSLKRIAALLFIAVLVLSLTACTDKNPSSEQTAPPTAEVTPPNAPILILNGEALDIYTLHYTLTEEYAVIPLTAFLQSIGASFAHSPLNEYGIQCYSFMDNRYIVVPDMHLFMLEDDYKAFLNKLDDEGKELSRETAADCGLLPKNKNKVSLDTNGTVLYWSEIYIDHISVMNALTESGIDIMIEYDYSNQTITVTLP